MNTSKEKLPLRELSDDDKIISGSILAVMASANQFWLVRVASTCGPSHQRWKGHWLDTAQQKNKRARIAGLYYTIAEGYDMAVIWKDTILCDVTNHIVTQDEHVWFLSQHIVDAVTALLANQQNLNDNSLISHPIVRTTRFLSAPTRQTELVLTQDIVRTINAKCSKAISMVCQYHYHER
jgi:hypothetical protein